MKKNIDIKEFREKGYLQELNRRFLHPLGLALEISIDDDGNEKLGGIWDCREDREGIYYDITNSDLERKITFKNKKLFIDTEFENRCKNRQEFLGFDIESLNENENEKFKQLINCLCTEEMINNGEAKKITAKGKIGYLLSYDAGLGFGMWVEDGDNEYELCEDEIKILD